MQRCVEHGHCIALVGLASTAWFIWAGIGGNASVLLQFAGQRCICFQLGCNSVFSSPGVAVSPS